MVHAGILEQLTANPTRVAIEELQLQLLKNIEAADRVNPLERLLDSSWAYQLSK